jgi:hypothetical protein
VPPTSGTYRELDAKAIVRTIETLERRTRERFSDSGLSRVVAELLDVAEETAARIAVLARPNRALRTGVALLIAFLVALVCAAVASLRGPSELQGLPQLVQVVESAVNDVVFLGIAILFLVTLEGRMRRGRALRALHELRSLAHVVDMHQLSKDPEQFSPERRDTASSPARLLSRYELARYLDYCSETLSLTGKLAALWAQRFDDPVILGAVNEVEALTTALGAKIWQKLTILDAARGPERSKVPSEADDVR